MEVSQLEGIELFSNLSDEQRQEVASRADRIDIEAGRRLVSAGHYGTEFFVIANGTAEVVRSGEHIADLGPGDFCGEMAILGDTVTNADVVASSTVTAMVMSDAQFRSLARRAPDVAEKIRQACRARAGTA